MLQRFTVTPLVLALCLGGCLFQSASSAKKLQNRVYELNKAARWGKIGEASGMVDATYREQFLARHAGWGPEFQIADTDVVHLEIAPDREQAIAMVHYQWYLPNTMTLYQTLVRQRWTRNNGEYGLISEAVVQGDGRLLGGPQQVGAPQVMGDPMGAAGGMGMGASSGLGY
ncbi:MAG: hypothetical protein OEZ06_29560 [Myxococcales bacterium]|nr:hypothetical protein [Myxococcales bacterium]